MIYRALFLSLITLNLVASNAGAAASASAGATSSTAEFDEKDRKSVCSGQFHKLIRQSDYNALLVTRDAGLCSNPECCSNCGFSIEATLRASGLWPDYHLLACLLQDPSNFKPDELGNPPTHYLGIRNSAAMLLLDSNNPNAQTYVGKTILHSLLGSADFYSKKYPEDPHTIRLYAVRYSVASGVNPAILNSFGQEALGSIENEELRKKYAAEIENGRRCYTQASQPSLVQIKDALLPVSGAFRNLVPIIQSYVGVAKNPKLVALLERLRTEAREGRAAPIQDIDIATALLPDLPETPCSSK